MAREIQRQWTDTQIEDLLNLLISSDTLPIQYRDAMYQLGMKLGAILNDEYQIRSKRICIACTVEDADYLAKGILDAIRLTTDAMFVTVFWNQRLKPQINGDFSLAPIIREFHDPGYQSSDVVIVLKSIIANACVVKTNLTRLLENTDPREILIVAPVLLKGAQAKLEAEFPEDLSARFKYVYFAEDDTRSDDGNIYGRLGFEGESAKNSYTPQLVKDRRSKISLQ